MNNLLQLYAPGFKGAHVRVVLQACARHVRGAADSAVRKSIELTLEFAHRFARVNVGASKLDKRV